MKQTAILIAVTLGSAFTGWSDNAPIPQSLVFGIANSSAIDYITFNGSSFPAANEICPGGADGCGGAFQATINPGSTQNTGSPSAVSATVWCVDYQLNVGGDSNFITDITALSNITSPVDTNVRYGNLTSVATNTSTGWANSLTDPANPGVDTNSAAYRYTLAAALISQYKDTAGNIDPANPSGSSGGDANTYAANTAIQEAAWYITYNNDYQSGATWPPFSISPSACGAGQNNVTNPNNYMCWVQYAENNADTVDRNQWAVISGPALASGVLQDPQSTSYQTFLVQVAPGETPLPEPGYYVLLGLACTAMVAVSRRWRRREE